MTNILENIVDKGIKIFASDIHIKLNHNIYYRVQGELIKDKTNIDIDNINDILNLVLNEDEKRDIYLKKDINKTLEIDNIRLRINIFLSERIPSFAIRIISKEIIKLEELKIFNLINSLLEDMSGLIIVTGISGSGKTTTLNSILDYINKNFSYNIITLEDPIEYKHLAIKSLINQRELKKDIETFEEGLVSSLREDPDIIFIGESNDLNTIKTALTAAETGHLVITTLHTSNCVKTIDRIIDVFPSSQQNQIRSQLSTTLKAVISQKLIKKDKKRIAEFEYILVNNAVSNLIRENKTFQIHNTIKL